MKHNRRKTFYLLKKRASVLVAVLFVLYAVADITVLQAYCGNEALGIPPASRINQKQQRLQQSKREAVSVDETAFNESQRQPADEQESEAPDDDCFCCCPHLIPASQSCLLVRADIFYRAGYSFFPKFLHSESHPKLFYRPPRLT